MEFFSIIQTMSRVGLGTNNPAFRKQVERLQKSLEKNGDEKEARTLARLLSAQDKTSSLHPSKITRSFAITSGENLHSSVKPPADKESGVPLAEIHFPHEDRVTLPILNDALGKALNSLIEEWGNLERLEELNVSPAHSCLLYGLPGTGKSHIAHTIAAKLQLPLVVARLDGLIGSFLGTTARNIANLFQFADRYKCILLLDEFDAIAKVRDDPNEVGEIKRVVNTLLQNLDARSSKGLTIAITNHEELLDRAVWRRFEVRVFTPLPEIEARKEIFSRYISPLPVDEIMLRFMAWFSDKLTGGDVETMVRNIKRHLALNSNDTILDALQSYVLTHAGKGNPERHSLLLGGMQLLAKELSDNREMQFTQQQIASLLGKNQATIGRWIKSEST